MRDLQCRESELAIESEVRHKAGALLACAPAAVEVTPKSTQRYTASGCGRSVGGGIVVVTYPFVLVTTDGPYALCR